MALTTPSEPGNIAVTQPSGQVARGVLSSRTMKTPSTLTFFCFLRHFDLTFNLGTSSLIHLLQTSRTSNWTYPLRHFACTLSTRSLKPSSAVTPGNWPTRKWQGVSGIGSSTLLETMVNGRLLINDSAHTSAVDNSSSVRSSLCRMCHRIRLTLLTTTSRPTWGDLGGLNFHSTSWTTILLVIWSWSNCAMASRSSRSAATKLDLLSDTTSLGVRHPLQNLVKAFRTH